MARAEGASFSTADTVPAAKPTRSATSRSLTLPGGLRLDFLFFLIPRNDRERTMIHPRLNSRIASGTTIWRSGCESGRLAFEMGNPRTATRPLKAGWPSLLGQAIADSGFDSQNVLPRPRYLVYNIDFAKRQRRISRTYPSPASEAS